MANAITWYEDSNARRKRVYYEGTDTVYEGMALCYNQDTTDNWTGYEAGDSAETGTTAEGNQNEGKYIRVEKPAAANLPFFAGFVAGTGETGKAGPCSLDIFVPNGSVVQVRGTDSSTIGEKAYVVSGDYEIANVAAESSVCIGVFMETVDRSTTEGLVLVKTVSPDEAAITPQATAGASSPSPIIWNQFDLDRLRNDFSYGVLYENDYMGEIDITTTDGYVITSVTSGAISGLATDAGGVLVVGSGGNAGADDGVNVQLTNCMVKPAAGVKIGFEARVNVVDAGDDQYYIGLAGVDTTLIAAGIMDDVVDKCGFYRIAASTADKISSITARTSADDATADVAALADATYTTVGFVIDGLTSVKFYVNGVLVETGTTTASIPNAVMCLSYVAQVEQTSADADLHVDWVRVAQIGGRAT